MIRHSTGQEKKVKTYAFCNSLKKKGKVQNGGHRRGNMCAKKRGKKLTPKENNDPRIVPEMRYKTPESRQKLCKAWCFHLSNGYTRESFPDCDPQTFRKYAREFPEDFNPHDLEVADRLQKLKWEEMIINIARTGKGNAGAVIFGIKNINGWRDRTEVGFDQNVKAVFKMSLGKKLEKEIEDEQED